MAEDEAGGFVWRYVVYRTPDGYCDVVELVRESDRPANRNCAGLGSGLNFSQRSESGRPSFVTGSVKSEAHRLLIDTRFDGVIETDAIEPPGALALPFDLFVVALPEGSTIVGISAVDAEGQVVDEYESGLSP